MSRKPHISLVRDGSSPNDNRGKGDHTGGSGGGGDQMEARVAKLESHVEYIRRDLDVMTADLKEAKADLAGIKTRLAVIMFGGTLLAGVAAWILNNRFDQVISLLSKPMS